MHSSSAPRAPHHTLAYYVSTRGWALMQYGIMKYNTLRHGADRAGRARGWACRGRRQGQANKAGRGSASAARPRHGGRTWHQPPAARGHMTGGRGCARLLPGTPGSWPPPEPGARRPRHRVRSVAAAGGRWCWCWYRCCHMMPRLSNSGHQYHCIVVNCPRSSLFRHNKPRVVRAMEPAID